MKATEYEMTLAVDAVARAAWGAFNPAASEPNPPFDSLPANVRMNLRKDVAVVAVAAIEAIPDRATAARAEVVSKVEALLNAEVEDIRSARASEARGDVRWLHCDLRYAERQEYRCEHARGGGHTYEEPWLQEVSDQAGAEPVEYVTLVLADLRAALAPTDQ